MAVAEEGLAPRLSSIIREIARGMNRVGAKADGSGTKGLLKVERQEGVKRVFQAYWTPFQISIAGEVVSLRLDIPKPHLHWCEAYLTPDQRNWILYFHEREDGQGELVYYRDYATPEEAVEAFFGFAEWYALTATDTTWDEISYTVAADFDWTEGRETLIPTSLAPGVQEALKKSTILWLRWHDNGTERQMPVWYVYDQKVGKIYVISGERQQLIPGAERLRSADVIFRQKGKNVRLAEIPATVRVLPKDDEWDERAEKLAEKRLNIPGLPEETARRWRDECEILELTLRN